jgi:hypothetical protein
MITELNKVDPEIQGGLKIDVVDYKLQNYRLHQVLEQMSRMFLFLLKCDSNNTSSKIRPRDARKILSQWKIAKDELEFSMAHNDLPDGIYEYGFSIAFPQGKEIQRIRNVKVKRIFTEMFNCARQILSVDSAKTQGFIAREDYLEIMENFTCVDACLARWIGSGADVDDTGIVVPAYEELGVIEPDVDSDYAVINEPSSATPPPKLPDVPDVARGGK